MGTIGFEIRDIRKAAGKRLNNVTGASGVGASCGTPGPGRSYEPRIFVPLL